MGYGYIRERAVEPFNPSKLTITPLCDVTLCVLVIFLVSATSSVEMIKLALPEAQHTAIRDMNLAVTISIGPNKTPTTAPAGGEAAAAAPAGEATTKPGERKVDPWGYYFEDDSTPMEARNLWTALKEIKGDADWSLALIRAGKDTPCEYVDILIQCLQGLGVDEFAFVMKTEENE